MSNDDVLEKNGQDESSSVDIAELLAAANSKVFDDENGLIDANKNFEKVSSFFDLIKSSNNKDTNLAEDDIPTIVANMLFNMDIGIGQHFSIAIKTSAVRKTWYVFIL